MTTVVTAYCLNYIPQRTTCSSNHIHFTKATSVKGHEEKHTVQGILDPAKEQIYFDHLMQTRV